MQLVLLDNHDSFTWNLVQAFATLSARVAVHLADALSVAELERLPMDGLVISPGPGTPVAAGISCAAIAALAGRVPILGVCLGHQCIAEVYGGKTIAAPEPRHGHTSPIHHTGEGIFAGLPLPLAQMRYHSLLVDRTTLPPVLAITAWTADEAIMGLRHRELPVEGVQFHPESVLSEQGVRLLENWLHSIYSPAQSP